MNFTRNYLVLLAVLGSCCCQAESNNPNTDWFRDAKYGVFMHFLPADARSLALVEQFDVAALTGQLEQAGAKYFVLTLGQNSGYFNSPNATYNRYTGYASGERCAKRDLPLDLFGALQPKGIKLMLYLPCQVPNEDARAQRVFGLAEGKQDQPLDLAFAHKWAEVIQEWSQRYGDKVAGWWFDGGYEHIHFNEPIAGIYAEAVKGGNPKAIVTFNPGVKVVHYTQAEDYTAGELNEPFTQLPASRWLQGAQWHALTFIGSSWGKRNTRYTAQQWADWVKAVTTKGGVVTLDMGPNYDRKAGPIGSLDTAQLEQVAAVKAALPGAANATAPKSESSKAAPQDTVAGSSQTSGTPAASSTAPQREHKAYFEPLTWPSEPPADCPFEPSRELTGLRFTGVHSDYHFADTWYPTWAADGNLYSPYTDGDVYGVGSNSDGHTFVKDGVTGAFNSRPNKATTGQAVLIGDDPLNLTVRSLGVVQADPYPYGGRYPCGSLVCKGVWYYGTYCLSPHGATRFGPTIYNWPWLGPLVGFRTSADYGKTWRETPHTPDKPLFDETGMWGYPVKIGSPHFVDFGQELEHSPDGKAYLVAHGAVDPDPKARFGNLSWITGDQVYLLRVNPSPDNVNDASQYDFYAGNNGSSQPVWTRDLKQIKPLLEWNNNMGCVTITYDAPLKKYLMCVTDGGNTCARMNTYILESNQLTGPWQLVTYMKNFGEQCYFANFPSKFISRDGRTLWLCYSANFASDWNGERIKSNPPGSHYGLVLQEVELLRP